MSDSDTPTAAPASRVWPVLRARDADALIRFLVDVLGFEEAVVYRSDDGREVNHAELRWPPGGGVMLGSAPAEPDHPSLHPGGFSAYLATDDVDAIHAAAVAAGATILRAPYDTDYGSHECAIVDPEGNRWSLGTYRGHTGD